MKSHTADTSHLTAAGPDSLAQTIDAAGARGLDPATGLRVRYFGDYELMEEIARGGMGSVWKARQMSLNRIVAIKMILAGKLATREEVERFRREAEAAANLQHPNIVAIHEIGEHDGQQYFSMDFVEGRDLAALVRDHPLPPEHAARYVQTIAEAIHFAHQRGTLHRDLKPQNVLIDTQDRPRITDFGLARTASGDSSLTHVGTVMGTPSYMSPEQAAGRHDQVGPHSDVYSLGAILYELVTGRPPFRAETAVATMQQVMAKDAVAPRKWNAAVPADLETICLKCLEKSPQRRYATAHELAEDLGRFMRQEPIHARPISVARKGEQWARRHPNYIAGVAALLFLGVACLAYGLWEQNQYLMWSSAHPGYVRAPGPRTALVHSMQRWGEGLFWLLVLAQLTINYRQTRGLSWQQVLEVWASERPILPPFSPRTLLAFGILGAGAAGYVLYWLMKSMDAYVWEGLKPTEVLSMAFMLFYFGVYILRRTVKEHRASLYGRGSAESAPLPRRVEGRILATLRAGDFDKASEAYRRAKRVTFAEAETAVRAIAQKAGLSSDALLGKSVWSFARVLGRRRLILMLLGAAMLAVSILTLLVLKLSAR